MTGDSLAADDENDDDDDDDRRRTSARESMALSYSQSQRESTSPARAQSIDDRASIHHHARCVTRAHFSLAASPRRFGLDWRRARRATARTTRTKFEQ